MEIKEVFNYDLLNKFELEDYEERRLYINDVIDSDVIDSIVYHIMRFNREDKGLEISKRTPILLYINSNGGSVPDGYAVIDSIINSLTPVYTINQGYCYSMGFLIFLAGHKRYSMPSATFLMHDGSTMGWDSTAKLKDRMDFETKQVEEHTKRYIMSMTKIDEKLYEEKYRVEWYFYPEEGKEYGVVDYIVGMDCTMDEII